MKTLLLKNLDPLIVAGLDAIGSARGQSRSEVIRDCIYTAVWHARHGGPPLRRSPGCGPMIVAERLRVFGSRLHAVDDWGLPLDPSLENIIAAQADSEVIP